jgi:hypothetical protein
MLKFLEVLLDRVTDEHAAWLTNEGRVLRCPHGSAHANCDQRDQDNP